VKKRDMMRRLQDKVALITGSAQGIGAAIAKAFVNEGAFVVVSDLCDAVGAELARSLGPSAVYCHLDVRCEADWIELIDSIIQKWGRLDVLVNNAGITGFENPEAAHDPENVTLQDWHSILATNLDGTFLGCKHAIRAMRPHHCGSIINISSRSGIVGIPGAAAYAASKAAVRNHTKSVALHCAEQGLNIRCNSIHPAAILTAMWDRVLGVDEQREQRALNTVKNIPLKRFGRVEEVAAIAVLLASDEAEFMTGSEVTIDGGLLSGAAAPPKRL
jgi:NAD(P)-dependent dehydrogenase (short-subunit alcohol dehydrogenase family)